MGNPIIPCPIHVSLLATDQLPDVIIFTEFSFTKKLDLEGWDGEDGREAREGGDMGTCVAIWLIRFVVQQKQTWYCEAIILQ